MCGSNTYFFSNGLLHLCLNQLKWSMRWSSALLGMKEEEEAKIKWNRSFNMSSRKFNVGAITTYSYYWSLPPSTMDNHYWWCFQLAKIKTYCQMSQFSLKNNSYYSLSYGNIKSWESRVPTSCLKRICLKRGLLYEQLWMNVTMASGVVPI